MAAVATHDRLSNLSDDLICHILSFLPTEITCKTSILSKRWASLYTKVPNLYFTLPTRSNYEFVHAVLLRRTEKIRQLRLYCSRGCKPYHIHLWVLKALDLKVEELDLNLSLSKTTLLPHKLFTSESLMVLKLHGNIQVTLPCFVYLRSLKVLHLRFGPYYNSLDQSGFLSTFLSSGCCPRLEELDFYGFLKHPLETSLKLKRLCLHLIRVIQITIPLQINVPALEVLDITDYSLQKYQIVNLFNVHRAHLCLSKDLDFDSLYRLLHGLSNVKSLSFNASTTEFLSKANLNNLHHPEFHNLLDLRVEIYEESCWNMLVSFLQNTPLLEVLVIEKKFLRNSKRREVGNSSWMGPPITLNCLSTTLKILEFRGIQNIKAELDFTRYIIDNSSKLEKVRIFTPLSKKSKAVSSIERNLFKGKRNRQHTFTWEIISV